MTLTGCVLNYTYTAITHRKSYRPIYASIQLQMQLAKNAHSNQKCSGNIEFDRWSIFFRVRGELAPAKLGNAASQMRFQFQPETV